MDLAAKSAGCAPADFFHWRSRCPSRAARTNAAPATKTHTHKRHQLPARLVINGLVDKFRVPLALMAARATWDSAPADHIRALLGGSARALAR